LYLTLGVSYNPNEYWSFRASYRYENIDGRGAVSNDWTANVVSVSASLRY
jgi:opacity protein-like surface antigen